ncbi:MAG: ABC transporter substrate-binding protein [Myxococcota bacterium]|nr:ABC transporter substrate-binding protein [Myxococcota bacterium]MEC8423515.1 ABC transporter substrate-binding protein [Myxococcota bacterium]
MIGLLLGAALAGSLHDARGVEVSVDEPKRIVVLGPAPAETVLGLGLDAAIVGVDAGSKVVPGLADRAVLGYHRQVAPEGVLALGPDLIIATEAAGPPAALAQLESTGVPLFVLTEAPGVAAVKKRTRDLGMLLDRAAAAETMLTKLARDLEAARAVAPAKPPRVVFVYARGAGAMSVSGTGTAADAMIALAGGLNAVDGYEGYKPLTPEALVTAAPDVLLLTERGLQSLGGEQGLRGQPGVAQLPDLRIASVEDALLLSFGPRTGEGAKALAEALGDASK